MAQYGRKEYWEERYGRDPEPFDWYQRYTGIKDLIKKLVRHDHKVLNVGCGNSRLSEDMYADGFKNIDNIDISSVVINAMEQKYRQEPVCCPEMTWKVMDVRSLEYPSEYFDVVLDKGTMDAMLCGEGSTQNADKMLSEIHRVLKAGGVFVSISYGSKEHRFTYLEKDHLSWTIEMTHIQKPSIGATMSQETKDASNVHYVYICTKEKQD
eukprot:GFYU01005051.1.p1 GENE.GFYU01005051.1~~GFYU01005051.1.p1  ORF type:complete len:210 (+),score=37.99 GFYU01005051.1:48-677(+)